MNDPLRLLSVDEVAQTLGCGNWFVNKLIQSGALPSLKIGKLRRIRPDDLDTYTAALRDDATDAREAQISRFRRRVSG